MRIISFLKYLLRAKSKHGVHSPFVYDFVTKCLTYPLDDSTILPIEKLRKGLLQNKQTISVNDYGAGSKVKNQTVRSIKSVVKSAAIPKKYGLLLARITHHYQTKSIIELGTSLGISSLYLSTNPDTTVYTIEGSSAITALAAQNFSALHRENVHLNCGKFEDTLPDILKNSSDLDLVYFDGNHQTAPTIDYFEQCLSKVHNDSIFVFDDIHWSRDMEKAWKYIQAHPKVTVTLDLYRMGIVFFRQEQAKEHFVILY